MDITTLSNHLWQSANILRGPVDAADFKTYIFPLLFFKRISDVWDEETTDALELSGGDQQFAEFPDAACIKINIGHDESDNLAHELLNLAKDEARWRHIGEEARKYISQNHQVDVAADSIISFIDNR